MEPRDSVEETDSFSGASRWERESSQTSSSQDTKCPICLDTMDNRALASPCMHSFCFLCIRQWAMNKPECPLCKQPLCSIIHNVRSNSGFDEYWLKPKDNHAFSNSHGRRGRYRSSPMQQHLSSERQQEELGVLFEAAPSQNQPHPLVDPHIQQMQQHLREQSRACLNNRSMKDEEVMELRRALYRSGLRAQRVEGSGRYPTISPEFFIQNPVMLHRLVPWLKRELSVLFGLRDLLVKSVLHCILENMRHMHLESDTFVEDLRPLLGNCTEHFLHEFISFARSPFNMNDYDKRVFYELVMPSHSDGAVSGESSVNAILPDTRDDPPNAHTLWVLKAPSLITSPPGLSGWDDETPGPSYMSDEETVPNRNPDLTCWSGHGGAKTHGSGTVSSSVRSRVSGEEGNLTQLAIGTSAQIPLHVKVQSPSPPTDAVNSDTDDGLIVGYLKPLAERTLESWTLSSDSEKEAVAGKSRMEATPTATTAKEALKSHPLDCKFPTLPSISLCKPEGYNVGTHWLSDSSGNSEYRKAKRKRSEEKPRCGTSSRGDAAPSREVSSRDENSHSKSWNPRSSKRSKRKHQSSREPSTNSFVEWDRNAFHSRRSRYEDDRRDWDKSCGHQDRSSSRNKVHSRYFDSGWSCNSEHSAHRARLCEQRHSRNQRERDRSRHQDKEQKRRLLSSWAGEQRRDHRAPRDRSWSTERSDIRNERMTEECHFQPAPDNHLLEHYPGFYRNAEAPAPPPSLSYPRCEHGTARSKHRRSSNVELELAEKVTIDTEDLRKSERKRKKSKHKHHSGAAR